MSTKIRHAVRELRDNLMLQIPDDLVATTLVDDWPCRGACALDLAWTVSDRLDVASVIMAELDRMEDGHPEIDFTISSRAGVPHRRFASATYTCVVMKPMTAKLIKASEPIPAQSSIEIKVGDSRIVIPSVDGVDFDLLLNDVPVEKGLPSAAYAFGLAAKLVLEQLYTMNKSSQGHVELIDTDFIHSVSRVLVNSPLVSSPEIRKHLVDFVELSTKKVFDKQQRKLPEGLEE